MNNYNQPFNGDRRNFIKKAAVLGTGLVTMPGWLHAEDKRRKVGIQLYTVRKEMLTDPVDTLKQLARMGYLEVESARSEKGNYYGLKPKEISNICNDLGMQVISGHAHIDNNWQQTISDAHDCGQKYLICSVLPSIGQSVDNYKKNAEIFSKEAEQCKKAGIRFGYHNHAQEFEKDGGVTLYDVLLEHTDANLVTMELDLGWLIASNIDPIYYLDQYPDRFKLWHLKDIDSHTMNSTEFGKGKLDFIRVFKMAKTTPLEHFFVEQEQYTMNAFESCKHDFDFLKAMKYD